LLLLELRFYPERRLSRRRRRRGRQRDGQCARAGAK
jgi:hypothetical protein